MLIVILLLLLYIIFVLIWFVYASLQHKKRIRKLLQEANIGTNRMCALWEHKQELEEN